MTEHERMLERVRASDRQWCESDLYWRTNRLVEDGWTRTKEIDPAQPIPAENIRLYFELAKLDHPALRL